MTPAINLAKKHRIAHTVHQYKHDPNADSYGLEAAQALGQSPDKVFKTLLFFMNGDAKNLAVAIVPVNQKLNLKLAAKASKSKKVDMANPETAQKVTGYVVGGISPLGQKKRLPTFLHDSAMTHETICVSAGKRGLELELSAQDLLTLTQGQIAPLCHVE